MKKINKSDIEDVNYINVNGNTRGIGRELSYMTIFKPIDTLIGEVTTLRAAFDALVTPNYPRWALKLDRKLKKHEIDKIPTTKVESVTNLDAIKLHLIARRIIGDEKLLEEILLLPDDIFVTSFGLTKRNMYGFETEEYVYFDKLDKYIDQIQTVVDIVKYNEHNKWEELIKNAIIEEMVDTSVGLFDGVSNIY